MAMKFFEVFEGLKLDDSLNALMEDTIIEKLTTDSQKTLLRVYLSSHRLIERKDVYMVQESIRKQRMMGMDMEVKIYERFELPEHFTIVSILALKKSEILITDYFMKRMWCLSMKM